MIFCFLFFFLDIIAYDFGIEHDLLRRVASYGCKITVVPSNRPPSETLKIKPDRILFSNGPGDPYAVPCAAVTVKELLGRVPVFRICTGR
jgi:carbamoyl-phosphate synthase small subunit